VEALQQIASVELDRFGGLSRIERVLERYGIAPDVLLVQAQCVAVATYQHIIAEGATKDVYRLTQGVASVLGVVLGPEDGKEGIASLKAWWSSEGEVSEQSDPLGLCQDSAKLLTIGASQVERS
jgi:hypothetical protein